MNQYSTEMKLRQKTEQEWQPKPAISMQFEEQKSEVINSDKCQLGDPNTQRMQQPKHQGFHSQVGENQTNNQVIYSYNKRSSLDYSRASQSRVSKESRLSRDSRVSKKSSKNQQSVEAPYIQGHSISNGQKSLVVEGDTKYLRASFETNKNQVNDELETLGNISSKQRSSFGEVSLDRDASKSQQEASQDLEDATDVNVTRITITVSRDQKKRSQRLSRSETNGQITKKISKTFHEVPSQKNNRDSQLLKAMTDSEAKRFRSQKSAGRLNCLKKPPLVVDQNERTLQDPFPSNQQSKPVMRQTGLQKDQGGKSKTQMSLYRTVQQQNGKAFTYSNYSPSRQSLPNQMKGSYQRSKSAQARRPSMFVAPGPSKMQQIALKNGKTKDDQNKFKGQTVKQSGNDPFTINKSKDSSLNHQPTTDKNSLLATPFNLNKLQILKKFSVKDYPKTELSTDNQQLLSKQQTDTMPQKHNQSPNKRCKLNQKNSRQVVSKFQGKNLENKEIINSLSPKTQLRGSSDSLIAKVSRQEGHSQKSHASSSIAGMAYTFQANEEPLDSKAIKIQEELLVALKNNINENQYAQKQTKASPLKQSKSEKIPQAEQFAHNESNNFGRESPLSRQPNQQRQQSSYQDASTKRTVLVKHLANHQTSSSNVQTSSFNVQTGGSGNSKGQPQQKNRVAQVEFCVQEELTRKDLNLQDLQKNAKIIKQRKLTDRKRHSHVPPKVQKKPLEPKMLAKTGISNQQESRIDQAHSRKGKMNKKLNFDSKNSFEDVREASDKPDGMTGTKFFTYYNNGETVIVKERAFPQDFPEIKDSAVYTYQNIKIPCLADQNFNSKTPDRFSKSQFENSQTLVFSQTKNFSFNKTKSSEKLKSCERLEKEGQVKNTKSGLHTINNVLNQSQESVLQSIKEEKGEKRPIVNRANTGGGVGPLNDSIIAGKLGESAKGRQRQRQLVFIPSQIFKSGNQDLEGHLSEGQEKEDVQCLLELNNPVFLVSKESRHIRAASESKFNLSGLQRGIQSRQGLCKGFASRNSLLQPNVPQLNQQGKEQRKSSMSIHPYNRCQEGNKTVLGIQGENLRCSKANEP